MSLPEDECAVKIAVRERPLREIYRRNEPSTISYHPSSSNILIVGDKPFAFDHVLPPSVSQKELFDTLVLPLVGKVLSGYNCTVFAYGQTGTGKSFTMGLNPESLQGENVGMIPRCLWEILKSKDKESNEDVKQDISASFIEIYSEKLYDLLSENPADPIVARGYKFTGGIKKTIENVEDGYALLNKGTNNRHVRPTKMNPLSSRSHAIFSIYLRTEVKDKITQSCFNLVDLAGSESVRRTGHQGLALTEGVHINQGLLSIGKVLQAITHGYKVIPYRDSVLSSVLQDSLNPNSNFTLLTCISPHQEDLSETLSTLRFAQNAKHLKHNPQINAKLMELKKTPFKSNPVRQHSLATPTPYKRPFSVVNTKHNSGVKSIVCHGNTFSTPNKQRKTENLKLNRTDIGLTPKEKQKVGSVKMSGSKVTPLFERESLVDPFNDSSLDSRVSLLSVDISTSTAIESQHLKSSTISPIVRKCMADMESMKRTMLRVVESLKDSQHVQETTRIPMEPSPLGEMKIEESQRNDGIVRCELFRASSPIFKIPEVPYARPVSDYYTSKMSNSTQNETLFETEETILSVKPIRRSRRLLSKTNSFTTDDLLNATRRKSSQSSSIKAINDARRRSIRLASCKNTSLSKSEKKEQNVTKSRKPKETKKPRGTKKSLVNNSIIDGYFEEGKENQPKDVKSALARHQTAILQMLNNASMKELQFLPQVGLKTAFQIVTQRTLHGKFKNFAQVGKLPIWRGKGWERFKEANSIS